MAQSFAGNERFVVQRRLGQGGMGVVYEAWDRTRQARVALKTLARVDASGVYRLKREFRALAGMSHPNLVALHELVCDAGRWFFTMDLVEGHDFVRWVRGERAAPTITITSAAPFPWANEQVATGAPTGSFDEARLRTALLQLAQGLCAVHHAGKLHRDLKPSNVLVSHGGHVTVLDFGLVRALSASPYASLDSAVVGTPAYMAPEQAAGEPVSSATDWYAVGVMLYESLTGVVPFGGSIAQLLTSKQGHSAPRPDALVPGLPDDLAALCSDLLRREPSDRPNGEAVLQRLAPSALEVSSQPRRESPFAGRAPELDALRAAFAAASERAQLVHVEGPAGMGKTALCERLLAELPRETVVLRGRCHERESVPYKALDAAIDALADCLQHLPAERAREALPHDAPLLSRIFPVLGRLAVLDEPPATSRGAPERDRPAFRRRAFAALRALFAALAQRSRLVLLIDDLQWGDADSAAVLAELLAEPDAPRLLLILAYRREEQSPMLATLLDRRWSERTLVAQQRIELGPLRPDEARALALELLGDGDAALARALARESDGHPEMLAELVLAARAGEPTGALRLDARLERRLEALGPEPRALLETVAIAAGAVPRTLALGAAGAAEAGPRALATLQSARLLRSGWGRADEVVDVHHARARELVLAQLTPAATAARHAWLAEAFAPSDAERSAWHWAQAGAPERALEALLRAAEAAEHALAFERAAELYRAAALHTLALGTRASLTARRGDALAAAGHSAAAAEAYLAAARSAGEDGDADGALELERRAAEHFLRSGLIDQGLAVMRRVLAAVGLRMHESPRAALASMLYHRTRLRLRGLELDPLGAASFDERARRRVDTCWSVAIGLSMVDAVQGADFQSCHMRHVLESGDRARYARALALEAAHVASTGSRERHERAQRLLSESERLGGELGDWHALGLARLMRGGVALFAGAWREAAAHGEQALSVLEERCSNVAWEIATGRRFIHTALYNLGELAELARRAPLAALDARARGDRFAESCARSGSAVVASILRGETASARVSLEEERERWGRERFALQHYLALQGLSLIDLSEGRADAALARLRAEWPALERSQLLRIQLLRTSLVALRAFAAAACRTEQRAALRDAAQLERNGARTGRALATIARAAVAARAGDADAAARGYALAAEQLAALDMAAYAAAARFRQGELLGGDEGAALRREAEGSLGSARTLIPMLAP